MKPVLFTILIFLLLAGCERPVDVADDDGSPPTTPVGLTIYYASDGEIGLEWRQQRSSGLRGYNIYRSTDDSDYTLVSFTSRFYFIDDSLHYDILYFYKISAVNYSGLESALTNPVSAMPVNRFAPRIPTGFTINARNWPGSSSIYLAWNRNEETDIAGYNIYKNRSAEFNADSSTFFASTPGNEFEDTSVNELYELFYYRIKAVDKGGLESPSSVERSDQLIGSPSLLHPAMDSEVSEFRTFIFITSGAPAQYRIVVQTSQFLGEIWQTEVSSSSINDTLHVEVPRGVFYYNTHYYWRVAAYTESSQPNSISPLNKFIIIR
jgi:hypothetical protein